MKMNRYAFISLFLSISLVLKAQTTLPSRVEASMPNALLKSVIKEAELSQVSSATKWGQNNKSDKFWVVYSDREHNTTYDSPNGGKYGELTFNETVRIAKISGGYALVYEEPKTGTSFPGISDVAKSKGWIPMDHLLLWNTCPADEKGIYYKALIAVNMDMTQGKQDLGKVYKNPDTKAGAERLKSGINFFFVMKKQGDLALLAKQYKMTGSSDRLLYGWVSVSSYTEWNQRSCLEPNWDPETVEQLRGQNVYVYEDKELNKPTAHFTYGKKNGDPDPFSEYRMKELALRYPILDNDSHSKYLYKCTTFGNGGNLQDAIELNNSRQRLQNITAQGIGQINMVIVIDGTSSMQPYFKSVKDAIKRGIEYFDKDQYNVRVGVVIFRDYSDGEFVTEYLPLSKPNDARLASFLDSGGKYGIRSNPKDHTYEEALFKGIELGATAKEMGFDKSHSNLMLIVGDCGNDINDKISKSSGELITLLNKYRFHLMSFQVMKQNSKPWHLFAQQMTDMVKGNMDKLYGELARIAQRGPVKSKFMQVPDGFDLKTDTQHEFYVGNVRETQIGIQMDPNKLSTLIQSSIGLFAKAIKQQTDVIVNPFDANTSSNQLDAAIDSAFIIQRIGAEYYRYIKQSNSMVAFNGYVRKDDGNGHNYWKPIVYISSDELTYLVERLGPVNEAAKKGDYSNRTPYINAMKALTRTMVPDITEEELNAMGTEEVMALINGLNESAQALKGPSLAQINEPKAVSNSQYMTMVNDFVRKYNNLQKIRNQGYKYSLKVNNDTYYWLPIELLP